MREAEESQNTKVVVKIMTNLPLKTQQELNIEITDGQQQTTVHA